MHGVDARLYRPGKSISIEDGPVDMLFPGQYNLASTSCTGYNCYIINFLWYLHKCLFHVSL